MWRRMRRVPISRGRFAPAETSATMMSCADRENLHGAAHCKRARAQHRTMATLHVYLHAAAAQTNYVGSMRGTFMEGGGGKTGEISASVPPGSQPVGSTTVGFVISKPGEYTLSISIDAFQAGTQGPQRITVDVPVRVT